LFYYQVIILGSKAPDLIYSSTIDIDRGAIIKVTLNGKEKRAVVLSCVSKVEFDTQDILEVTPLFFDEIQLGIAKFISQYYFSTLSQSLNLFSPYHKDFLNSDIKVEFDKSIYPKLSKLQQNAYHSIKKNSISLLFGVTGSGKTEIFISLMIDTLLDNKSAIMLMPEISLTPQMEQRLKRYFGSKVAIWHSKLTKKRKDEILQGVYSGDIRIVAGARSALFVPFKDLGLIVVDEEHDDSYKSMSSPRYNARDLAVYMGKKLNLKVLLASATPTPSSYFKYNVVRLKEPYIKSKKRYKFISGVEITDEIISYIDRNHKEHNQSLVFVPTRANFKYLYCSSCGKTHSCPFCSVGMALHRQNKMLKCHYCNYTQMIPTECSFCGASPLLSNRIGTQEAIEQINAKLPDIKIEQFDRDSITTPNKLKKALERFASAKSDILLGTQMLSKGHDYANITLAVITGVDYILGLADYRARERAMSLVVQLAGRSGRAKESMVLIQSQNSDFFGEYLGDYEDFLIDELEFLEIAQYPPYINLARVLIAHKDDAKGAKITLDTTTYLKSSEGIEIVGSGKAPIEKISNRYRYQILIKSDKKTTLLKVLHSIKDRNLEIDMDPVEFS